MKLHEIHEVEQGIRPPENIKMTLEEFLEHDIAGYEYIEGKLVPMSPVSRSHGRIGANVVGQLYWHVRQNQLGEVYTVETTFQVGERVLKPDVAFVSADRLIGDEDKGLPIPPDLAIEVVSPTDVQYRVSRKAFAYLEAGPPLVCVLEPASKTVTVYRSETDIEILARDDTLTGEDIVPGFSCAVARLFE